MVNFQKLTIDRLRSRIDRQDKELAALKERHDRLRSLIRRNRELGEMIFISRERPPEGSAEELQSVVEEINALAESEGE